MKRSLKHILGVTLLEIMLVLAIAAMVLVMSIRYYQNASYSQQALAVYAQLQTLVAAADNIAQGGTGYSAVTAGTGGTLTNAVGANNMTNIWGGAVTVSGQSATAYTLKMTNLPSAVCQQVASKITANSKFTDGSKCSGATGTNYVQFTYTSTN